MTNSGSGSVIGIATRYMLDGPGIESWGGARFSAPVHRRPGRGADSPTPSSAEVLERVELYLYPP